MKNSTGKPGARKHHDLNRLLADLGDKEVTVRRGARESLVAMGEAILPTLAKKLESAEFIVRWEIIKTLKGMRRPACAPLLVDALEDDEQDVRWVAAEGLAALGRDALRPLVEAFVDRPDSTNIQQGVHHVLSNYRDDALHDSLLALHDALGAVPDQVEAVVAAERVLAELD